MDNLFKEKNKTIKSVILLIFVALLILRDESAYTQSGWSKLYGGGDYDEGYEIKQTSDRGYIFVGYTWSNSQGEYDIWVVKMNAVGVVEWQKTIGGVAGEVAESVIETPDGGYILLGNKAPYNGDSAKVIIIKLDSQGNILWQKRYGESDVNYLYRIRPTLDGGYIAAGYYNSIYTGYRIWVIKIDSSGNYIWQKRYYVSSSDVANDIYPTADGGYILACRTYSSADGYYNILIIKLYSNGDIEWFRVYKGGNDEEPLSIIQTLDGGYAIAGYTLSYTHGYSRDAFMIKLRNNNAMEWSKSYGGEYDDYAKEIIQTKDGNYMIVGYTVSPERAKDIWIMKIGKTGEILWQKSYGGDNEDWANSIVESDAEGFIIAGYTLSFGAGASDAWLLKIDTSGNIDPTCNFIYSTDATIVEANFFWYYPTINTQIISLPPVNASYVGYNADLSTIELCVQLPGAVPDNDNYMGVPLVVYKNINAEKNLQTLILSWGDPIGECNTQDYAVYRGILSYFYSHTSLVCSTNKSNQIVIPMDDESYYYLITAILDNKEGSYGVDSLDNQRPAAYNQCYPQAIGTCNTLFKKK